MDNGEEAVIMGRGGRRIGSLQGRVTTVGPWCVFKQYVDEVEVTFLNKMILHHSTSLKTSEHAHASQKQQTAVPKTNQSHAKQITQVCSK